MVFLQNPHGFVDGGAFATGFGKECGGSRLVLHSSTSEGDGLHGLHSISADYAKGNHEELRLVCNGFFCGGTSATDTGKECRGTRVVMYSPTPEEGLHTLLSISAMPHYADRNHEELRLEDYELSKGFLYGGTSPSAADTGKKSRGTRVVLYSSTPEGDGLHTLHSISAMPHYADRNHEELRLEDYELCKGSIQNQGNAFQQSNSLFGPCISHVPSSRSTGVFLIPRKRSFQEVGGCGGYKAWIARVMGRGRGRRLSFKERWQLFKGKPRTQGRKSRFWTGSSQGTSSTRCEESGTYTYSDGMIQSISAMPIYADASHEMLRLEYYGQQNKGSSQGTSSTKCEESGAVASYCATKELDRFGTAHTYSDGVIQSISAMPRYEDKSHEMLRLEYYEQQNKEQGGEFIKYQTLSNCSISAPLDPIDAKNLSQSPVMDPNPPSLMPENVNNFTADGASFSLTKSSLIDSPSTQSPLN